MWAAIVSDRNCLLSFFLERSVGMVGRGSAWPNLVGGRLMSQSVRKADVRVDGRRKIFYPISCVTFLNFSNRSPVKLGLESRVIVRCECERKMHGQQVGSDRRTGVSREPCGTMRVCDMIWNFECVQFGTQRDEDLFLEKIGARFQEHRSIILKTKSQR